MKIGGKSIAKIETKEVVSGIEKVEGREKLPIHPDRFPLTLTVEFTVGNPQVQRTSRHPPIWFRVEHLVSNIRESNIATLVHLDAANIGCLFADGLDLNSAADENCENPILGVPVSFPWMSPAQLFNLTIQYHGLVPQGMKEGDKFRVQVTLIGEAKIVF